MRRRPTSKGRAWERGRGLSRAQRLELSTADFTDEVHGWGNNGVGTAACRGALNGSSTVSKPPAEEAAVRSRCSWRRQTLRAHQTILTLGNGPGLQPAARSLSFGVTAQGAPDAAPLPPGPALRAKGRFQQMGPRPGMEGHLPAPVRGLTMRAETGENASHCLLTCGVTQSSQCPGF